MRSLSDAELLNVWEQGLGHGSVQRALSLLAAACPRISADELAHWSVGRRDAALMQMRAQIFGPRVVSIAKCPECGQDAELVFETSQLLSSPPSDDSPPLEQLELEMQPYRVRFRLPNSLDLIAAEHAASDDDARGELLTRCTLAAECEGDPCSALDLPAEVAAAMAKHMAAADPLADVRLSGDCPHCGIQWLSQFDVVAFFWTELGAWARRQLHEVHLLASAYGWREAEILALGAVRRGWYLEMLE